MDTLIERAEHEEFVRRIEVENKRLVDEDKRQNRRLDALENSIQQISSLAMSTEKLAINMENMLKVQKEQNIRLETLEARDGEMWRKITGYMITAAIGIMIGFLFQQIGL